MSVGNHCAHCDCSAKSRRREFNPQTWSLLILWGEVDASSVDQPICEDCYAEIREVLIDRADEVEVALKGENTPVESTQTRKAS